MTCFKRNQIVEIEQGHRAYYSTMVTSEREAQIDDDKLFFPTKHWSKSLAVGRIIDSQGNTKPDDPLLYSSKLAARIALIWYLCTVYGKPELWINKM